MIKSAAYEAGLQNGLQLEVEGIASDVQEMEKEAIMGLVRRAGMAVAGGAERAAGFKSPGPANPDNQGNDDTEPRGWAERQGNAGVDGDSQRHGRGIADGARGVMASFRS